MPAHNDQPSTPPRDWAGFSLLTPPPTNPKRDNQPFKPSPGGPSPCVNMSETIHHHLQGDSEMSQYFGALVMFDPSRQQHGGSQEHHKIDANRHSTASLGKARVCPRDGAIAEDAEEDEDIVFTGQSSSLSLSTSTQQLTSSAAGQLIAAPSVRPKRPSEDDQDADEEEISYVGSLLKRPRHESQGGSPSRTDGSSPPLRTVSSGEVYRSSQKGMGNSVASPSGGRTRGSGSQTLSNHIRANILQLLLPRESLLDVLRHDARVRDWKDIAELVGARREDFDRVRHASRWLQDHLPEMVRRGAL